MGNLILRPITHGECHVIREWRNAPDVLPMLRTGSKTEAEQDRFYNDIIVNPASPHRYYALEADGQFVGMGGLTYLNRLAGFGEISLLLGPQYRRAGLGSCAVGALLTEAFGPLQLWAVFGECYAANPARGFWCRQLERQPYLLEIAAEIDVTSGDLRWRWLSNSVPAFQGINRGAGDLEAEG